MVAPKMESHWGGSTDTGLNQTQTQTQNPTHGLNSDPLSRQESLSSLTLDEVLNQIGDLGKPLGSMNLDELLKTLWTAEGDNQALEGVEGGPTAQLQGQSLNQQSDLTLSTDLRKKTVDEVWQYIQHGKKMSILDRKTSLGEMTLEDLLVKAGIVPDSAKWKKIVGFIYGGTDSTIPQHPQWMNYQISSVPSQQQQNMMPMFMPSHLVQQPTGLGGNPILDAVYPETQMNMRSSRLMGTLSDPQTPGRKRVDPDDTFAKSVERRRKRMIRNRESAARSRARKLAYTQELENKVSCLGEENERLKRLQEVEKALLPPPEPRYQLRRTSSAPM